MNFPSHQIQQLLAKEMSRKEFIQQVGVILLGAVGVSAFLARLSSSTGQPPQRNLDSKNSAGYGARVYGR